MSGTAPQQGLPVQIDPRLTQQQMPPNDFTIDPQYHNVRITTPIGRFTNIHVAAPHSIKQKDGTVGKLTFSAQLLMAPALTLDIYNTVKLVADTHWPFIDIGNPQTGQIERRPGSSMLGVDAKHGGLHYPIRNGDDSYMADPAKFGEWRGLFFINCGMQPKTKGGMDQRPITLNERGEPCDPALFYPGCYGRMNITVAPFEAMGNKGVTFFLNAVQFADHGTRIVMGFDAVKAAQDAFGRAGVLPPATLQPPQIGFGPHTAGPGSVPPGGAPIDPRFTQGPAPQVQQYQPQPQAPVYPQPQPQQYQPPVQPQPQPQQYQPPVQPQPQPQQYQPPVQPQPQPQQYQPPVQPQPQPQPQQYQAPPPDQQYQQQPPPGQPIAPAAPMVWPPAGGGARPPGA